MFRHIVLLTLVPDATEEQRRAIVDGLEALPPQIPALRSYEVRVDAGLADGNAHIGVVADFDDATGWQEYTVHPAHRAVIERHILPMLANRTAIQFER
jgi:hypothetical protein